MKLLIAGLSTQAAGAVELIAKGIWPGATFVHQRDLRPPTAPCTVGVLDLVGLGLGRWTAERQAKLARLLDGRHSVCMAPPDSFEAWRLALPESGTRAPVSWLQQPVSASAVRQALLGLRDRFAAAPSASAGAAADRHRPWPREPITVPMARRVPPPPEAGLAPLTSQPGRMPVPPPPAAPADLAGAAAAPAATPSSAPRLSPDVPATSPVSAPASVVQHEGHLGDTGYGALLTACPDIARNRYLNLVSDIVRRRAISELRLSPQSGEVIHAGEHWVASNIPTPVRRRLSEHELMLQLLQVEQPAQERAFEHARKFFGRRADGRRPLDAYLWSLVFTTFEKDPPVARGDLRFLMHRFPNFTRLPKVPDLFVRMALVCLQRPQSITSLRRSFAAHDPGLVTLFVVCVVMSGMAEVLDSQAPEPDAAPRPAAAAAPKRGFFKALLHKLFAPAAESSP